LTATEISLFTSSLLNTLGKLFDRCPRSKNCKKSSSDEGLAKLL
jgi:hypothetical protein